MPTQPPQSSADRLAARARDVLQAAAGLNDPEATEDALREAARLRVEARQAATAETHAVHQQNEAAVHAVIQARREARRNP
ncbi:hypothetical protein [Kitasatospora purpeofusca]|uniref:hypothetical protein n=1 Tax=Kitasatospora purpeofusca TaxID=67352 RepID=UPI00380ED9C1